jgi:hypothetical protein
MVQIQRYLQKTNDFQDSKHLPMLNSLFVERFSKFNPYSSDNNFKTYMKWARRSPYLIGFLNIIATDMLSDSINFLPTGERSSGKNKVLAAKDFWENNYGPEIAEETIYDLLITGIGYNWIGKINDTQLKEVCLSALKKADADKVFEKKELEFKAEEMFNTIKKDNPQKLLRKLRHVASSTVTMHTDEYDVLKYIQRVGVNVREFEPSEILKFKLMPLDGKVFPFPPMECLLAEVYLLWLISQNYISFFENGGKPDNVFILPKEIAGSKNHQYLIDTLQKYKKIENKHGNLVFTGDLTVEKMMEVESQMENKDLGLYIVGILAMMYGVPVSRIPFLVGKAANNGDAGGLADSGYWRKISVWQSKLECVYNRELFKPFFGVEMKFRRGYLQDEVRETQTEVQKNSIAEQRINLGLWTVEKAGEYLGIDEEIIREAQLQKKTRDAEEMKSGLLNQNFNKDKNVIPNQDAQKKAEVKKNTQDKNSANKKPLGI